MYRAKLLVSAPPPTGTAAAAGSDCSRTHHGEEETQHHKEVVVPREGHGHTEAELAEAGEHHDPHPADSSPGSVRNGRKRSRKMETFRIKSSEAGPCGLISIWLTRSVENKVIQPST